MTIDTVAPASPVLTPASSISNSIVIAGTAEPGSTVRVYLGSSRLGSATAGAAGTWNVIAVLAAGANAVSATATDVAGNESARSAPVTFTIQPQSGGGGGGAGGGGTTPAVPSVTFGALDFVFDGRPKAVGVTTVPAGLEVAVTYDGSATAPTAVGSYTVVATVVTAGVQATARGTLTIARAPQTIALSAPASLAVGGTTTVTAASSSGLPVALTLVGGPATLAGDRLTATGAGTIVVREEQAGNASYLPAVAVERSVVATMPVAPLFVGAFEGNRGALGAVFAADGSKGDLLIAAPGVGLNLSLDVTVAADGTFVRTFEAELVAGAAGAGPRVAAAPQTFVLRGRLRDGVLSGSIEPLGLAFSLAALPAAGPASAAAGFYRSPTLGAGSGAVDSVVGPQGQVVAVARIGGVSLGGTATLAADGTYLVDTGAGRIEAAVGRTTAATSGTVSLPGRPAVAFAGTSGAVARTDRLINLSSLGRAGVGDRTLISGFVIGGTGPRPVIIRGVGPALAGFGVAGPAANPALRIYRGSEVVAENDDWSAGSNAAALAASFARVGAFALPAGSGDAALALTLPPGAYTLHLSVSGGEGAALAEIYDAESGDAATQPRLANLSTRTELAPGQMLTGGFVVAGQGAKRLLVRAVGPGLVPFGVARVLADPRVTIVGAAGVVAESDNWSGADVAAAAAATGAFALTPDSRDAAVVLALAPGAYTAQVTGVGATVGGSVLLEIYELP